MSFSVNSVSSSLQHLADVGADGRIGGSSSRPPWSSLSLSSRAEHSMPWLSTPRSLPSLIRKGLPSSPGGNSAPTSAQRHLDADARVGRPQTMLSKAPCPASTWQTRRRSALGCWTASLISPTTTLRERRRDGRAAPPLPARPSSACRPVLGGQRRVAEFAQPGLGELHVLVLVSG